MTERELPDKPSTYNVDGRFRGRDDTPYELYYSPDGKELRLAYHDREIGADGIELYYRFVDVINPETGEVIETLNTDPSDIW